jgi:carboxypeptidase Q
MRATLLALALAIAAVAADSPDLTVVHQIKAEAFERSQVMDTLQNLSDRYGPRLTASPEFKEASDWALKRLQDYGLENPHTEKWGPFGRSWSLEKFALEMTQPRYSLLSAFPLAWSSTVNGEVTGEPMLAPLPRGGGGRAQAAEAAWDRYVEKYKGKLRGKVVFVSEMLHNIDTPESKPELRRYTEAELHDLAVAPDPVQKIQYDPKDLVVPDDPAERARFNASLPQSLQDELRARREEAAAKRTQFFLDEGVLALVQDDQRARDALTFSEAAGPYDDKRPLAPPTFIATSEHYNRIARLLEGKTKIEMRVTLRARISDAAIDATNLVAEIPGGSKKDEIVMVGAHFDSWHSATGATDNGAGSAVMIEVVRILKALNLKMDRTVRIALWSGEEEGLLGSKAYVKEHFGDPKTMKVTEAHAKLSGYFNLDNGSGKIRGVYLQGNDAMRPVFDQWLAPFRDEGVTTMSIRNTGGTDHLSFDAVGLPGFQFIQDPLDYQTVTHHSNMDNYDHAIGADLMQAAAVIASVVYDAATRPDMLPRKPLPKAQDAESSSTR